MTKNRAIPGKIGYNDCTYKLPPAVLATLQGLTPKELASMPDQCIPTTTKETTEKRFWSRTVPDGACIRWTGLITAQGYGRLYFQGAMRLAHRVAYMLVVGDIPDGLMVRHSCDNRWCVNPDHLLTGTHHDNMRDAVERQRMASGDRNGLRRHPERNPMRLYPDLARRGEKSSTAKLTWPEVKLIRRLLAEGTTKSEIARRFGVAHSTVRAIGSGKSWKVDEHGGRER